MNFRRFILIIALSFVFSSIVKAEVGADLRERLREGAPDYLNKEIKAVTDLALIKDPNLRNQVEAFCKTCTEVSSSVSMGAGGEMKRIECSDNSCPTLCPISRLPKACQR